MNRSNAWLIALLEIHCMPNVEAPPTVIDELMQDFMICDSGGKGWTTTEKAKAYIDALHRVPFPVRKWVMGSAWEELSK